MSKTQKYLNFQGLVRAGIFKSIFYNMLPFKILNEFDYAALNTNINKLFIFCLFISSLQEKDYKQILMI